MEERKQLSIGLFEENPKWLALLQTLLTHAGHTVSVCRERGEGLRAWLATCNDPPGSSGLPPYDLLIVDVAEGELLADEQVYAHLKQIVCQQTPPLIALTAGTYLSLFVLKAQGPVEVLPLREASEVVRLFQLIEHLTGVPSLLASTFLLEAQQSSSEQFGEASAADQAWLDRRWVWLEQRLEWLEQRQCWIEQRRAWLERWMAEPGSQNEWLEEQREWLEQQEREVSLQRTRQHDLERWLLREQRAFDQQRQQHFRQAQ